MALVSLHSAWQADDHSRRPRRGKNELHSGGHCGSDARRAAAGVRTGSGADERDLPNRRGRSGGYHQAKARECRRRLHTCSGHRRGQTGADTLRRKAGRSDPQDSGKADRTRPAAGVPRKRCGYAPRKRGAPGTQTAFRDGGAHTMRRHFDWTHEQGAGLEIRLSRSRLYRLPRISQKRFDRRAAEKRRYAPHCRAGQEQPCTGGRSHCI